MPTCKGCNQEIVWIKTKAGKSIPCDPKIIEAKAYENIVLVTDDGSVLVRPAAGTRGRVTHFATCPKSKTFRKKKPQREDSEGEDMIQNELDNY